MRKIMVSYKQFDKFRIAQPLSVSIIRYKKIYNGATTRTRRW